MSTKEKLHIGPEELHGLPVMNSLESIFPRSQPICLSQLLTIEGRGSTHKQLTSMSGLKLETLDRELPTIWLHHPIWFGPLARFPKLEMASTSLRFAIRIMGG